MVATTRFKEIQERVLVVSRAIVGGELVINEQADVLAAVEWTTLGQQLERAGSAPAFAEEVAVFDKPETHRLEADPFSENGNGQMSFYSAAVSEHKQSTFRVGGKGAATVQMLLYRW